MTSTQRDPPSNVPRINNANHSSKAPSPNLLLKMLEACARHKRRHENERREPAASTEEERQREQKCLGELNQFAALLPRIEATVKVTDTYSDEYKRSMPTLDGQNESDPNSISNKEQTKHLRPDNDQDDAGNLCALYRAIVRGSICSKAAHHLFTGQSSAGDEEEVTNSTIDDETKDFDLIQGILPRVLKLLRFLSQDPLRTALLPLKLLKNKKPNHSEHDAYQDEDIGSTIGSLLATFQNSRLRLAAIQDLINLAIDLNTINEARALFIPPTISTKNEAEKKTDNHSTIRVRAFSQITSLQSEALSNRAENVAFDNYVDVPSQRSLLALQCGVWVALQHLIQVILDSAPSSSPLGGDKLLAILESARLVFLSRPLVPEIPVIGWTYSRFDLSLHLLLSLRVRLGILGLLQSIVTSNNVIVLAMGSIVSTFNLELAILVVEATQMQLSRSCAINFEGQKNEKDNKNGSIDSVVRRLETGLSSMYSAALSRLLLSMVYQPEYAREEIWLHCFPRLIDCVSIMDDAGDKSLGHVVIQLIRTINLHERKNLSGVRFFRNRCNVRGIFSKLFDLANDSSDAISNSTIFILIDQLLSQSLETDSGNDVENCCSNALIAIEVKDQMDLDEDEETRSIRLGNKRRRLQGVSNSVDTVNVMGSCNLSIQASFSHAIANALHNADTIAKKVNEQKRIGSNVISLLSESDIILLRSVTSILRILCSLRIQGDSKFTFRYTDEVIVSLFQCIETICDALANPKGQSGHVQYVEIHLVPLALSLVVNVGLHVCQLPNQADAEWLRLSVRETMSNCALASLSLLADEKSTCSEGSHTRDVCTECNLIGSIIDTGYKAASSCLCRFGVDVNGQSLIGFDLNLKTRCILLAAMFPVAISSRTYEPTLSTFRCTLEDVSKQQQRYECTKSMLITLPTLFLSIASSQVKNGIPLAKQLVSLIEAFNFEDNVIRHTRSDSHEVKTAAYLVLGRFARIYYAASIALSNLNGDTVDCSWKHYETSTIRSDLMGLLSLEEILSHNGKIQLRHKMFRPSVFSYQGQNSFRLLRYEPAQVQFAKSLFLQTTLAVATTSILRKSASYEFLKGEQHYDVLIELYELMSEESCNESSFTTQIPLPIWFLIMPFACSDTKTQVHAMKNFGEMLFSRGGELFLAYFTPKQDNSLTLAQLTASEGKIAGEMMFCEIEYLLFRFCGLSSNLLFSEVVDTATHRQNLDPPVSDIATFVLLFQSLCESSPTDSAAGCFVFQRSLLGLVRIWVASSVGSRSNADANLSTASCASLDALREIFRSCGHAMTQASAIMSQLFSEFFLPSVKCESLGSMRYQLLATFIHECMLPSGHDKNMSLRNASNISLIMEFLDKVYPSVIVKMIEEEDHVGIQMCTAFRMYLLAEHRNHTKEEVKARKKNTHELIVGSRTDKHRASHSRSLVPGMSISTKKLIENAKLLCSKVEVLKEVLPQLLLQSSRSSLHFFITKVCQSEVNISDFLREKVGQHVLKTLVWELGCDDPEEDAEEEMYYCPIVGERPKRRDVLLALTKGFLLKEDEHSAEIKQLLMSPSEEAGDLTLCTSTAGKWISPNFMYLLVNVVVYKWNMRTEKEKFQATKCLRFILRYLSPADSPQYMPQITAAINNVMSMPATSEGGIKQLSRLRLMAVNGLFDFIKIVASHNVSQVGENLTLLIVTLFPLFDDTNISDCDEAVLSRKRVAEMMEWLVNQEDFVQYFREVPFLPYSEDLRDIRSTLLQKGINIDDVRLLSQHTGSHDGIDDTAKLHTKFHERMNILLHIIESQENKNVRKVVVKHMTALIKANRDLFQNLIVNEELASMHFLTVVYDKSVEGRSEDLSTDPLDSKASCGLITKLLACLLTRCVDETDKSIRDELAKLLGEIGAIDPNRLGREINSSQFFSISGGNSRSDEWRLSNPPWQTQVTEYQLRLVTNHFVSGLKSAPTTLDQHKVSFGIQELLKILHKEMGGVSDQEMAPLLKEKLDEADVSNIVEPFWSTNYMQADTTALKQPPFFKKASTYFAWISQFSKYMLTKSHSNRNSLWKDLFYACRSAIRSQAGIDAAEFIFPLLVLDGVCFGDKHEEDAILSEIHDALSFEDGNRAMEMRDREKSANLVFTLLDVLKHWSEQETERIHKPTKGGRSKRAYRPSSPSGGYWPSDSSIKKIERLLARIPFSLCATAASNVGMHARALQYLELDGRRTTNTVGETTTDKSKTVSKYLKSQYLGGIDLNLTQNMLGELNDFDTMIFVSQMRHKTNVTTVLAEDAAEREMYEDWEGSIRAYERLLDCRSCDQNEGGKIPARKGLLRSLLKLGRLDSVLNQAHGMSTQNVLGESSICSELLPSAVEAAWRLGKWSVLDNLVHKTNCESSFDSDARFQLELGRALHNLHSGSATAVAKSLTIARDSVMASLSGAARVSYTQSYPCLVQLHALREVEELSSSLVSTVEHSLSPGDIISSADWKDRLSFTIPDATGSNAIINSRLAISRLVDDPSIEGAMWLEVGKSSRKGRFYQVAEHSLVKADVILSKTLMNEISTSATISTSMSESMGKLKLQFAKLKHAIGESTTALKIIEEEIPTKVFQMNNSELQSFFANESSENEEVIGRRILQATEWMVCGGLRGAGEIKKRYQTVLKLVPNWERAHFYFAKFLDSRLSEMGAVHGVENVGDNTTSNKLRYEYLMQSINHYGQALTLGEKHVYQALPRMLALWLEFTSQTCTDDDTQMYESQEDVNKSINGFASKIPEHIFYTALPQLISSVVHTNEISSNNVALILKNVLTRYPGQAMWSCGWLRFSNDAKKKKAGDEIFAAAIKRLRRSSKGKQMEEVLIGSKLIFTFFINLAEYNPKKEQGSVKMKVPPFGTRTTNFVPPIQAALTISPGVLEGSSTDAFPTFVPRMRAFDRELKIMHSKAKPKKVKVYACSPRMAQRASLSEDSDRIDEDIGEMHFLVKKEAKGDLRKDSRVQDFNNVVNRLFAGRGSSGTNKRQRLRLQLRTFSVVCLAEDSGILEWVPNTESLRSVISNTFNPQVEPTSVHRRGSRLTNFNDADMRNTFIKCQDLYFKKGNLSLATKKFYELVLQNYRPVMYWWFVQNFSSPHAWFEARTNFATSTAVWSAVGHIIGLGDRHSENILIDTRSGECVHVDFDCIFDKGLLLPRPEVIPFRLTPNMVDAFGPSGVDGMYTGALIESMNTLRKNKDTLLSVLEPFLKDPVVNLKSNRSSEKYRDSAKDSIAKIEGRLNGVYNLKNPNKRKVKRQDGYADNEDELANSGQLSVEGQVQKMIMEATSHENLVQVYIGWMPWI